MPTTRFEEATPVQNQHLMDMLMELSPDEISKFRRLLHQVNAIKRNGEKKSAPVEYRHIDPNDGGPTWDLGFVEQFDRLSCYEDVE